MLIKCKILINHLQPYIHPTITNVSLTWKKRICAVLGFAN